MPESDGNQGGAGVGAAKWSRGYSPSSCTCLKRSPLLGEEAHPHVLRPPAAGGVELGNRYPDSGE